MQNDNIITFDIKKIFHICWSEKWKIVLITTLFGILGLIYGFSLREEFVSTGKILPEAQGNGNNFGDFLKRNIILHAQIIQAYSSF
jgi:uncharacterized protein involved in exopolysaccharide biosynthesis